MNRYLPFLRFFDHYKDSRTYLEWTKALDDYGVLWYDATNSGDVMPRLEVGRLGDELFLSGPHLNVSNPLVLEQIQIAEGGFVYVGDHQGRFFKLSDDKVQYEAVLLWCPTCSESYFGTRLDHKCSMCSTSGGWMTESGHLAWFGYSGRVNFHPMWRSWYDRSADSPETGDAPDTPLNTKSHVSASGDLALKNDLFDEADALQAGERESGQWERLKKALSGSARVHGWPEAKLVEDLARLYPNFAEVCDFVLSEIALAPHRRANQMRIPNILIVGGASCGKSSFCQRLAQILAVDDWERFDLGQQPSSFELSGTDSGYNRSKEGRVLRLLASKFTSPVRNPVMILDELDKVDEEMRYSPLPALLSLLEKNDASRFRDAFFGIPVDASGIQFLATANDRYRVKGPLASRFELFTVADYTQEQFTDVVIPTIYAEWTAQFHEGTFPSQLSQTTRKHIAEQAGFVPRRVQAILVTLASQRFREFLPVPTFESLAFEGEGR